MKNNRQLTGACSTIKTNVMDMDGDGYLCWRKKGTLITRGIYRNGAREMERVGFAYLILIPLIAKYAQRTRIRLMKWSLLFLRSQMLIE